LSACRSRAGWRSNDARCGARRHRGVRRYRADRRGVYGRRASVEGEISLRDASIGSGVVLSGARLHTRTGSHYGCPDQRRRRVPRFGFTRRRGADAPGADRSRAHLAGATLHAPGRVALDLDGIRVEGDVDAQGLVVDGAVQVRSAVISTSCG